MAHNLDKLQHAQRQEVRHNSSCDCTMKLGDFIIFLTKSMILKVFDLFSMHTGSTAEKRGQEKSRKGETNGRK